jgi:hypothetical protein
MVGYPLMKHPLDFTLREIQNIFSVEKVYDHSIDGLVKFLQEREKLLMSYQVKKETETIKKVRLANVPKRKIYDDDVECLIIGEL